MSMFEQNEWQIMDERLGTLYPYYTNTFLKELDTWDLSDKIIWEYGVGHSSTWYGRKCRQVWGVDDNHEWASHVIKMTSICKLNIELIYFHKEKDSYVKSIGDFKYDIVIVDGEHWRDECVIEGLKHVKEGGFLIIDNYMQPEVYIASEEVQELLSKYECKMYPQDGHLNWTTATFKIQ